MTTERKKIFLEALEAYRTLDSKYRRDCSAVRKLYRKIWDEQTYLHTITHVFKGIDWTTVVGDNVEHARLYRIHSFAAEDGRTYTSREYVRLKDVPYSVGFKDNVLKWYKLKRRRDNTLRRLRAARSNLHFAAKNTGLKAKFSISTLTGIDIGEGHIVKTKKFLEEAVAEHYLLQLESPAV